MKSKAAVIWSVCSFAAPPISWREWVMDGSVWLTSSIHAPLTATYAIWHVLRLPAFHLESFRSRILRSVTTRSSQSTCHVVTSRPSYQPLFQCIPMSHLCTGRTLITCHVWHVMCYICHLLNVLHVLHASNVTSHVTLYVTCCVVTYYAPSVTCIACYIGHVLHVRWYLWHLLPMSPVRCVMCYLRHLLNVRCYLCHMLPTSPVRYVMCYLWQVLSGVTYVTCYLRQLLDMSGVTYPMTSLRCVTCYLHHLLDMPGVTYVTC